MKEIKFINNSAIAPTPVERSRELAFRDIVFKEELRQRKCRFGQNTTWLRFLPPVSPSRFGWIMAIDIHRDMAGVTFTSPRTLDENAVDPVQIALRWFQRNEQAALSSRLKNPDGFKLYSQRYGVSWVVSESADEGQRLRLFYASLYDGVRGGNMGLGYKIYREANAKDEEPGSPTFGKLVYGDVTEPGAGRLVKVERTAGSTAKDSSYMAGIGKNPAPVEHYLAMLSEEESEMITALEDTIYIPTEDEVHDILRRYIGAEYHGKIFGGAGGASVKPVIAPKAASTPAAAPEPERASAAIEDEPSNPEPKPAAKAAPAKAKPAPAPEAEDEAGDDKPVPSFRELVAMLQEPAGVKEALAMKDRLSAAQVQLVLETASEMGIATE